MPKNKSNGENAETSKVQKKDAQKTPEVRTTTVDDLRKLQESIARIDKMRTGTITFPKISPFLEEARRAGSLMVSPREQQLEDEITQLKKERSNLTRELASTTVRKTAEVGRLNKTVEELNKKQRLRHLLDRVNEGARAKLLESEEFGRRFEDSQSCIAVIMAVDIRRSTELMLKARQPNDYADFITNLCADLTTIILDNYGVFDKFTGDGILAFFPDFYSREDAAYWAIKAAEECHNCFSRHYKSKRNVFKSVLMDVGLGIGIDYGESHLVRMQDGFTVIGTPVVYACRMSGAEAGQTLLNQPAYEEMSSKFGPYINFQESEIDIRHEGRTLAYLATLSKKTYKPILPDWLELPTSTES